MIIEIIKFFVYAILIVMISKYILVKALRRLAENLNLKPQTVGNISGIATSIPEFLTVTISSFQGLASTSLYNIISSNIINLAQYILSLIINKNYRLTEDISIDYGVMERYDNIFVIEGKFGWDDVGSWSSVDRYGEKDNNGNVLNSSGVLMKSSNNIVLTKKKILLNNVDDLIVVETDDCILVSSKEHAQDIKLARNYM